MKAIKGARRLGITPVSSIKALGVTPIQALGLSSFKNEDNYKNEFYGLKNGEGVDFKKVINFLKSPNRTKINYVNYQGPNRAEGQVVGTDGIIEITRIVNIPFIYKNQYKQEIQASIKCGINKKFDYIKDIPFASLLINQKEKNIEANLTYFYEKTEMYRKEIASTSSETDFEIDDQYKGVKLISNKIVDLYYLLVEIQWKENAEWYKTRINKTYVPLLENCKNADELIWLYENAADFTLAALKSETLWKHICQFYNYDTLGAFSFLKDASSQLMRALFAFNSIEKIVFLMKKLNENQEFVSQLYEALDDEITFMGKQTPCKVAFISVLSSFSTLSKECFNFTNEFFVIGKEKRVVLEKIEFPKNQSDKGKYKIEQKIKTGTGLTSAGGVSVPYDIYEIVNEAKLFPLDMVTVLQDETQSLLSVPALFLAHEQHQKNMEGLAMTIRLGVDMLAIALAVETLGTSLLATEATVGGTFFATLGAIDGAIALGDIGVQLNKDKFSKEFLEKWEKIYFIGGIATASPLVVASLYKLGGRILASSAKAEIKNFVQSCMIKLLMEREISNFSKNTLKVLKTNTEIVEATKGALTEAKTKVLNQYGMLLIEGEFKTGKTITKEAALVYKGEIILHAERYDFFNKTYPLLKNINHEKEFVKLADELLVYGKEYPVNALKPLVTEAQAMAQYGNIGKSLVNVVDNEIQYVFRIFLDDIIDEKVMVSGMVYKKGSIPKYFTASNFLKKEIAKGKGKVYLEFLENLHPTLKIRLDKHIAKLKMNGVLSTKNDLLRAGKMGSHGEIRALDKLLKEVDPQGKLGEAIFQDIVGYNRFLRDGAKEIQPCCVHCYYLTSGVNFIGF